MWAMDQRLSFVTLPVLDRSRSRDFYVDGLGWEPLFDGQDVLMMRVGERLVLSLWDQEGFEAEVGPVRRGEGHPPLALAHNVATEPEVDAVLAVAAGLGAEVRAARRREWGGYSGYFLDPDGVPWEVAVNPGDEFAFVLP